MTDMHPEGHLGLAPIAAKMAFAGEDAEQKAELELPHRRVWSASSCFTVGHTDIVPRVGQGSWRSAAGMPSPPAACFTVRFHVAEKRCWFGGSV